MNDDLFSVANTLKASWLELRLAKWFGTKIESVDEYGIKVTQSLYKGRLYFIDFKEKDNQ